MSREYFKYPVVFYTSYVFGNLTGVKDRYEADHGVVVGGNDDGFALFVKVIQDLRLFARDEIYVRRKIFISIQ